MFCGECGTENPDTNQFCKNCGNRLKITSAAPAVPSAAVPASVPPVTAAVQPALTGTWRDHKVAIAAIACGLLSFVFLTYIFAVLAVILGIFAATKKDYLGLIGIAAAVASIFIDLFYFFIF